MTTEFLFSAAMAASRRRAAAVPLPPLEPPFRCPWLECWTTRTWVTPTPPPPSAAARATPTPPLLLLLLLLLEGRRGDCEQSETDLVKKIISLPLRRSFLSEDLKLETVSFSLPLFLEKKNTFPPSLVLLFSDSHTMKLLNWQQHQLSSTRF